MNEPERDLILETFNEMEAEAQITPTILEFPDDVILAIEAYEKAHSVDRDRLIGLAMKAQKGQIHQVSEVCARLIDDPESFAWPSHDPLLCIAIGFLVAHALRWADKVQYGLDEDQEDEDEPADWWKATDHE
jgi:hypothetical protein